jgi:hypothetical protein
MRIGTPVFACGSRISTLAISKSSCAMAKANEPKSQMESTKSTELKPDHDLLPSGAPHAALALRVPHTRELSHRKSEGTIRSVGAVTSSMP